MQNHTFYNFHKLFVAFSLIFRKKFMRVARAGTKQNDIRQPSDETIFKVARTFCYKTISIYYAPKHALLSAFLTRLLYFYILKYILYISKIFY